MKELAIVYATPGLLMVLALLTVMTPEQLRKELDIKDYQLATPGIMAALLMVACMALWPFAILEVLCRRVDGDGSE